MGLNFMGYSPGKNLVISRIKSALDLFPANVSDKENYITEAANSHDIAFEAANKICFLYGVPDGQLDPEHIAIAAGLKNLGRILYGEKTLPSMRLAELVEEQGIDWGISNSQESVNKVAQTFRPHPQALKEWFIMSGSEREDFLEFDRGFDITILRHETLPEYLVTYSGIMNFDGTGDIERAIETYAKFSPVYEYIMSNGGREIFQDIFSTVNGLLNKLEIMDPEDTHFFKPRERTERGFYW